MDETERIGPARRQWRLPRLIRPSMVGRHVWRHVRLAYRAVDRFLATDMLYMASALAFSLIIAIFPFILFLTALAGLLGDRELANYLTVQLFNVLPQQVAQGLEPEIWNVLIRDRGGGLLTFGLVIMLASVTSMVETIRGSLNRAYGLAESRSILRTVPESMLFVVLVTLALIVVAFVAVILPVATALLDAAVPDVPGPLDLIATVGRMILALVLAILLWALHRWLPAHGRRRPALWPGILLTLVLWYIAEQAFTWYMSSIADYTRYYAGLAGIVAALLFFYIAAVILLFGGAFNRAVFEARREREAARALTTSVKPD